MDIPGSSIDAKTSAHSRRPASRKALAVAVCVLAVVALVVAAILLWPARGKEQNSQAIPASAFLIRNGKFDCSTLYDAASLAQLADSGLSAIPGFDSSDAAPNAGPGGRVTCGNATSSELGVAVSYHLVSQPSTCGTDGSGGWRHGQELRGADGTVLGLASMLSDDSHGCLFVAGMRDAAITTPEADAAIAEKVKHIAEGISPVLEHSLRADASESAPMTPTFIRNGHYDCRAYAGTTTMREAEEIGLTKPILSAAANADTGTPVTCGFTKDFIAADVLTSADANAAICTEHSGVPVKAMPGWFYFVDGRSTQQPSKGSAQGEISLSLLHRDQDKGCIIVRSYSLSGSLSDTSDAISKLSSFAGSIDALNALDDQNEHNQTTQQEEK